MMMEKNDVQEVDDDMAIDTEVSQFDNLEFDLPYFYHRDPAYKPWILATLPKKPSQHAQYLTFISKYLRYAIHASKIALILSIIVGLDFILPNMKSEVEILGFQIAQRGTIQMVLDDGSVINLSKKARGAISGKQITIFRTIFFRIPFKMKDKKNHTASFEISVYGFFCFGPIVMFLTSLFSIFQRKDVELKYNLGVVNFILILVNILFFNVHRF